MEGLKKDERLGSRLCGSPSECRSNVWCDIMPQLKAKPSHSCSGLCTVERTTFITPLKCLASHAEDARAEILAYGMSSCIFRYFGLILT